MPLFRVRWTKEIVCNVEAASFEQCTDAAQEMANDNDLFDFHSDGWMTDVLGICHGRADCGITPDGEIVHIDDARRAHEKADEEKKRAAEIVQNKNVVVEEQWQPVGFNPTFTIKK